MHVLRKMFRNKWMVLCLIIGSLLAVTTISSIPIYANSIFQRMLIKDMESYQVKNDAYPGQYIITEGIGSSTDKAATLKTHEDTGSIISNDFVSQLGIPILAESRQYTSANMNMLSDLHANDQNAVKSIMIQSLESYDSHASLIAGAYPSADEKDGYYEVMVSQDAMDNLGLSVGSTATVTSNKSIFVSDEKRDGAAPLSIRIKVTGVFKYANASDLYWSQPQSAYKDSVVMNAGTFEKIFLSTDNVAQIATCTWYYALDYNQMKVQNTSHYASVLASQQGSFSSNVSIKTPMGDLLGSYLSRQSSLSGLLWILQIPIIMMLLLYIFMVSKLIVDFDSNDIAVQKSRGASNLQIFNSYLLEGGAISVIGILLGPWIGYAICRLLGMSSGFLEFVSRKGVQTNMIPDAYLYSLLAVAAFMATMLIPVLIAARGNIVKHKRSKSRNIDKPFWSRMYLDLILLGVSAYGYFVYQNNLKYLASTDTGSTGMANIDPLLFMISTIFILGAALLFLRLYPLFIRLVFWIGKKHWSPGAYASLINVSRTKASQFLMVFLILTVSLGIFDSVSARTINQFVEDQVQYEDGADIVLQASWTYKSVSVAFDRQGNMVPYDKDSVQNVDTSNQNANNGLTIKPIWVYNEPAFSKYTQLDTIKTATKVYIDDKTDVRSTGTSNSVYLQNNTLMGIIPDEFGKVAWSRSDLLPTHINNYLNLMTQSPNTVYISKSFADKMKVSPGASLNIRWSNQTKWVQVTVGGIVDYWPGINPVTTPDFVIGNLNYLNEGMNVQPYQVWMKRTDGATTDQVYKEFQDKGITYEKLTNMQQDLISQKNDPSLQGINGTLTLGFLITMTVTLIGFLIYWIFNIRNRTLQFGILRAMGLTKKKLIEMIIWEQCLISGVAILAGLLIGWLSSNLFVPLLKTMYSVEQLVPPFRVIAYGGDYLRILIILAVMLVIGSVVLGVIISRIKMDQALKLGED